MGRSVNPLVLLDRSGPVAILTLNRPERHNSLVPPLLHEMLAALETIRTQSAARAVVLQANSRSFSTGGDVRGFYNHIDALETYANTIVGLLNRVILALLDLPVPIVAAVHGIVTGGSLGLVLAADIVDFLEKTVMVNSTLNKPSATAAVILRSAATKNLPFLARKRFPTHNRRLFAPLRVTASATAFVQSVSDYYTFWKRRWKTRHKITQAAPPTRRHE
jgi:hypothetical protein